MPRSFGMHRKFCFLERKEVLGLVLVLVLANSFSYNWLLFVCLQIRIKKSLRAAPRFRRNFAPSFYGFPSARVRNYHGIPSSTTPMYLRFAH